MKRTIKRTLIALILICFVIISCTDKQVGKSLPRSTPEAEGVSSKAIITFLDSAATSRHEFHSFMFLRHGKVIAEGWWKPYSPDLIHTLNSASKSFTATAVGLAIAEKKLSLDDKVISFFPEYLPDTVSANLAELKVKDLLSMTVGLGREPSFAVITKDDSWVRTFLSMPVVNKPGTKYMYNSTASYMLSAIVQKVTGQKVIDYLTPRLFNPLGIEGGDWEVDPEGINTGGWGLRLKTEDLAKFGQLYLQKGKWNGKQILQEEWVDDATSLKIYQRPEMTQSKRDSSNDSQQGYCYQFWRARNNSYMANGASGQFVLVIPEKDAVVIFTAESNDMWGELDMAWKYFYPALKDEKLPEDEKSLSELKQRIAALALPVPAKNSNDAIVQKVSGKTFNLAENNKHIKSVTLQINNEECNLNMKIDSSSYDLAFGSGVWKSGVTTKKGPSIFGPAGANQDGLPPFKVNGAFTWKDDKTLELTLRYIENVQSEMIVFHFDGIDNNKVVVDFGLNDAPPTRFINVEGTL